MSTNEDPRRAARRSAMPITTALLAEFAEFSPKVIYAAENGQAYGKPPVYVEVFTIPAGYAPMREIVTKAKK